MHIESVGWFWNIMGILSMILAAIGAGGGICLLLRMKPEPDFKTMRERTNSAHRMIKKRP